MSGNLTSTGTVSPGSSIGTLNLTGNLTLAGTLQSDYDATTADLIAVSGARRFQRNAEPRAKRGSDGPVLHTRDLRNALGCPVRQRAEPAVGIHNRLRVWWECHRYGAVGRARIQCLPGGWPSGPLERHWRESSSETGCKVIRRSASRSMGAGAAWFAIGQRMRRRGMRNGVGLAFGPLGAAGACCAAHRRSHGGTGRQPRYADVGQYDL